MFKVGDEVFVRVKACFGIERRFNVPAKVTYVSPTCSRFRVELDGVERSYVDRYPNWSHKSGEYYQVGEADKWRHSYPVIVGERVEDETELMNTCKNLYDRLGHTSSDLEIEDRPSLRRMTFTALKYAEAEKAKALIEQIEKLDKMKADIELIVSREFDGDAV